MEKVYQKTFVTETEVGDCWRACISSILEVDSSIFPDPNDYDCIDKWEDYSLAVLSKLDELGYELLVQRPSEFTKLTDIIIAVGKSPRGEFNHCVVWQDGIIHDPHPDNSGIENILFFEQLIKK